MGPRVNKCEQNLFTFRSQNADQRHTNMALIWDFTLAVTVGFEP